MALEAVSLDIAGTVVFQASQGGQAVRAVQDAGGGIKSTGAAEAGLVLLEAKNIGRSFGVGRGLDLAA